MEEQLIEAVRGKTCLYDVKHPDYIKFGLKDNIWQQIAEDLKLKNGNVAKKAWEKLRNNHRDALRRQRKNRTAILKTWRFQESMEFLVPYMGIRTSHNNSRTDTDYSENSMELENEEAINEEPPANQSFETTSVTNQKHGKKRELNTTFEEHQQSDVQTVQRQRNRNDPLFHFFMSMYETARRLPPLSQHNIKTKIFNLVSQEELLNLGQYSSPRSHSSQTQNYDSDGGTYDSLSSPAQPQQENGDIIVKEEVPDSVYSILDN